MKSYSERAEATREKIKIYKNQAKARRKKILISVVSVCTCLLIALNVVIFFPANNPGGNIDPGPSGSVENPGGSVEPGEDKSEYRDVIEAISAIWGNSSEGSGNDHGEAGGVPGDSGEQGPASGQGSSGERYEETTDNQVAGVIEGDLIKRTNKYIYYLSLKSSSYPVIRIYPIAGAETECIAEFTLTPQEKNYEYGYGLEMYLSEDGSTVTLILPMGHYWWEGSKYYSEYYTEAVNIDVSDHSNIKITERYCVSGSYVSSRLVNEELLLVTNYTVSRGVDFSDEEQFIPSTGTVGEMTCIPAKDIYCPQKPVNARFTVVCSVDVQTLEEKGSEAFLSYSENVYVSANNIYLTNGYRSYSELYFDMSHEQFIDYRYMGEINTEIARVEYGGELEYKDSFTVEGEVVNRFCMDEKEGVLRVVTSLHKSEYWHYNMSDFEFDSVKSTTDGASLYCVDIQTYETVGKLENFAPEKDTVQSVRFDGDKVYVCTAVIMTDPVFAIDISDYNNIIAVDTGEIPGYSIALRKFYGDTLLGIGYDSTGRANRNLKIEIYKETENSVESVAAFTYLDEGYEYDGQYYEYAGVGFSQEYKSYFIDAERGLIGLGLVINAYYFPNGAYSSTLINRYVLLQYDGVSLNLLLDFELEGKNPANYGEFYRAIRAVYIDGMFYVFTENGLTVTELNI